MIKLTDLLEEINEDQINLCIYDFDDKIDIKKCEELFINNIQFNNSPYILNTNIFTEVKHIQYKEMRATNHLKDMFNDELAVKARIEKANRDDKEPLKTDLDLLDALECRKRIQMDKIIRILDEYLDLDKAFEEEMRMNRTKRGGIQFCGWLKM